MNVIIADEKHIASGCIDDTLENVITDRDHVAKGLICANTSGATARALDLPSTGHGFKSYSAKLRNNLGKLFTPMCLCHQTV